MSGRRRIAGAGTANSCYFRTSTTGNERKALVQITERCNLHCAHCFVSALRDGSDISLADMRQRVLPRLRESRVTRVTLTGGEPFAHPDLLAIVAEARQLDMSVTICTNATLADDGALDQLRAIGGVKCNVSLDGFSAASHGRFRGSPGSFEVTKRTMRALADRGLLKGVLVTPNTLAQPKEYGALCEFARDCGAEYVLMNPLSSMGRGVRGIRKLGAPDAFMRDVAAHTAPYAAEGDLDVVRIRFPNDERPLTGCEAGRIVYVFANGDVTVCPYLVFAAKTPQSAHDAGEFIVGNVLTDEDIPSRLDGYRLHDRSAAAADPACSSCALSSGCGRGCPAAVVAAGGRLGDRDRDQCPVPDPLGEAA